MDKWSAILIEIYVEFKSTEVISYYHSKVIIIKWEWSESESYDNAIVIHFLKEWGT